MRFKKILPLFQNKKHRMKMEELYSTYNLNYVRRARTVIIFIWQSESCNCQRVFIMLEMFGIIVSISLLTDISYLNRFLDFIVPIYAMIIISMLFVVRYYPEYMSNFLVKKWGWWMFTISIIIIIMSLWKINVMTLILHHTSK